MITTIPSPIASPTEDVLNADTTCDNKGTFAKQKDTHLSTVRALRKREQG